MVMVITPTTQRRAFNCTVAMVSGQTMAGRTIAGHHVRSMRGMLFRHIELKIGF
jgi:hypothetical protein